MNQIECEILKHCLEQGENTWLSEPCFTRDLKKPQKAIENALKTLFKKGSIKRKCGWYLNDKRQQICIFYYQTGLQKMNKKEICALRDDIVDVILIHQYDLSDGFCYYSGNAMEEIEKEIKTILIKAIGDRK